MEKIVVFAPIANASDDAAMIVNPRLLRSTRAANTQSDQSPSMERDFTRGANVSLLLPSREGADDPFTVRPCDDVDHADGSGSRPMVSLTAHRSFCLQPKYRSVVWIETCPSRN